MTKIGKDFVFSLKFFVFSAERDRAAFLTRLVVFAERAEPRSLQGWWFLRNGQSRVSYEVGGFFLTRLVVFAERAEPRSLQGEVR